MKTTTSSTSPRTQLGRDEWISGATDLMARAGIDGVRVEILAKTLGVTKGSFYWHFKDRKDLLDALLETWRAGRIRDIEKQTALTKGKERDQARHLIDVYSAARNRKGISIELAIRDWARRDASAAEVVEKVDGHRLECTRHLFRNMGYDEGEAKARSLLLYAYVFGQSLMLYEGFDERIPALKDWVADRIVDQ
jgi:AcrR family transcriptional regulator